MIGVWHPAVQRNIGNTGTGPGGSEVHGRSVRFLTCTTGMTECRSGVTVSAAFWSARQSYNAAGPGNGVRKLRVAPVFRNNAALRHVLLQAIFMM